MELIPISREHFDRIAELHCESFGGDFLPSFGAPFLTSFYEAMFKAQAAFGYVGVVDGDIVGFCITTLDVSRFFSATVKKGFFRLSWLAGLKLIRNPRILKKIFQTFLYRSRSTLEDVKAEIVIWAVDSNYRQSGVGNEVVVACEEEMIRRGVKTYKYTACVDKKAAHKYFEKKGHTLVREFELYGKTWHLFQAWLPDDPAVLRNPSGE